MSASIKTFDRLPRPQAGSARPAVPRGIGGGGRPLVGVIRNVRSHRNRGRDQGEAPGAEVIVESTEKRRELVGVLDRFAGLGLDYLAISGGDGTVRDVLTTGAAIFGDEWPTLIVLPKGKTNALAADLGAPADWRLAEALAAAERGSFAERRPLVVAETRDPLARVQGFMLGAGLFTKAVSLGQRAHRWGAFNAVAVGVTTLWAVGQAFFAGDGNLWRQRVPLRLTAPDGAPLPGPAERFVFLASTLENFALGLKPFPQPVSGLKLAVLDTPARGSLAWIPLVAAGRRPDPPESRGYHWHSLDAFAMAVGEPFILDGEAFPAGDYRVSQGPLLRFVVP